MDLVTSGPAAIRAERVLAKWVDRPRSIRGFFWGQRSDFDRVAEIDAGFFEGVAKRIASRWLSGAFRRYLPSRRFPCKQFKDFLMPHPIRFAVNC